MLNDLIGHCDPTADRVDGQERSFKLIGFSQVIEERRDGRDFIGLFGHAALPQDQPGIARIGAQRVQRFEPFARIVGAPRSLAVDGNQIVPVGSKAPQSSFRNRSEQDRVDAVDQCSQPAHAWDTKRRESSQKIQMMLAPGDDVIEIIPRGAYSVA